MRVIPLWCLCLAVVLQSVAQAQISLETLSSQIQSATEKRNAAEGYLCDGDYWLEICRGEDDFILDRVVEFQRRGDLTPAAIYAQKCVALVLRLGQDADSQHGQTLVSEGNDLLDQALGFMTLFDYDLAWTKAFAAWDKFSDAWRWAATRSGKLTQLGREYRALADEVERTFRNLYPNG